MDEAWLAGRRPPAPEDLRERVRKCVAESPVGDQPLLSAATRSLRAACNAPGRVRASAFHLLTADALITYACEEALDAGDAEAELAKLLAIARLG